MKSTAKGVHAQQVKQRLIDIVEHEVGIAAKKKGGKIQLNDSLLEEWKNLLAKMLVSSPRQHQLYEQVPVKLPVLPPVLPGKAIASSEDVLLRVQDHKIDVYPRHELSQPSPKPRRLIFEGDTFKKFSAYCVLGSQKCLIFGGSQSNNPNFKSREVMSLNLVSGEGSVISELPHGVSSHSAVRVGKKVAIVGGNKNFNIPTKECILYDIPSQCASYMAPLNFVSASHTTIAWKDMYVFKIGGIGSCFEEWGLSPYIERYSWKDYKWDVINPKLRIQESLLSSYSLFAHCLAYVSSQNSIVIMGGFDFSFNGSNNMLELSVEGEDRHVYHITKLGTVEGMQPGGFIQSPPVIIEGQLHTIQTTKTQTKFMTLGKKIHYP